MGEHLEQIQFHVLLPVIHLQMLPLRIFHNNSEQQSVRHPNYIKKQHRHHVFGILCHQFSLLSLLHIQLQFLQYDTPVCLNGLPSHEILRANNCYAPDRDISLQYDIAK